jgi:4-carboxymuconolactone decarboxylase
LRHQLEAGVARIPYADIERLADPRVRAFMRGIPPLNLLHMEAHAEGVVESIARLSDGVLNRAVAPDNLRVVAFLRLAEAAGSPYEFEQLRKVATAFGLSPEKIEAARTGGPGLDHKEEVVARLAAELAASPRATEATVAEALTFLGSRELVEIIVGIGFYLMQTRVIETLAIDLEEPPVALSRTPSTPAVEAWRHGSPLPSGEPSPSGA